MKTYRITEDQIKTLGGVIQECLAQPIDEPTDPPVDPPQPPPVQPGYPEQISNYVTGDGYSLPNSGAFSFMGESVAEALRRGGLESPFVDAANFAGWDFPRFTALDLDAGSRLDFSGCFFADQTRNALAIENRKPGTGCHARVFDSAFLDNYAGSRDGHTVALFMAAIGGKPADSSLEIYNSMFLNSGTPADEAGRNAIAGITDTAIYIQGRGKHLKTDGCAWVNYAAQAAKGGWEVVEHRNGFMANGAFGGFFGADAGELDKHGEFRTQGRLENMVIYGQTDVQDMPHAYAWMFNGGCDVVIVDSVFANPRPVVNTGRRTHAFHIKPQGNRPIRVHFGKNVRVCGYDSLFGGGDDSMLEVTGTPPVMEPRLPELDLISIYHDLRNGRRRPDATVAWAKRELGVA